MNQVKYAETTPKKDGIYYLLIVLRIFVGILFIFSGLIKANDPSGLANKMDEFFEAWHMTFMNSYSLAFSVLMIVFEIMAGVAMILGYAYRTFSLLILILMIFFTFLTGYAQFSGKVKECGCFGDCIPLEAWQSFVKDIVLLVLVWILYLGRKKITPFFKPVIGTAIMTVLLLGSLSIQWYALEHLPYYDCLPYKIGNNIWNEMQVPKGAKPDVYKTVLIYEKDGKTLEFTQEEYTKNPKIWNDPSMKFIDQKVTLVEKGNATPKITDFGVISFSGDNYTEAFLKDPTYTFVLLIKSPDQARPLNLDRIKHLAEQSVKAGINFYYLVASDEAQWNKFKEKYGLQGEAYTIDGTVCKTIMRSNPGLLLLKEGTILGKWAPSDYPKDFTIKNDKIDLVK